ncbi:MAG: enoyl-CoA hydratase/isomerase family protein [Myxococcota bacterium]
MDFETLLYEVDDGVATLTLNRPERHNAFNLQMAGELRAAWEAIKTDPAVVCAILTGAGERAVCTGMDVADIASGAAKGTGQVSREDAPWLQLTAIHNRCWKPVITAVNGMVVGGGLHFIADSDLIVCAEHATFFDTHVKVGLIAGIEPIGLARRMPLEAVMRLALLGGAERLSSAEAQRLGLVGEVVSADQLMVRARELAATIAQHSPTALAETKRVIWESLDTGLDAGIDNAWSAINDHTAHPDLAEGAAAFVEKRKPRWAPFTS